MQRLVRLEGACAVEATADQHVFVGEGEHGPAHLLVDDGLEHAVALGGALDRPEADEHARRATDTLEGEERKALDLVALLGHGDEHPGLGLLRQVPDLEAVRTVASEISHFGQLGITQRRAVLGFDLDRHTRNPGSDGFLTLLVQRSRGRSATWSRNSLARPVHPGYRDDGPVVLRRELRQVRAARATRRPSHFRRRRRSSPAAGAPAARRGAGTPANHPGAPRTTI
ncbi:unannotated protein [freshwater metagenome]|uniref:Unannotated protein n=1 Tax=freshwater metagenome TaxID=449393 RepID=A0A6J6U1D8_9ZZZZ